MCNIPKKLGQGPVDLALIENLIIHEIMTGHEKIQNPIINHNKMKGKPLALSGTMLLDCTPTTRTLLCCSDFCGLKAASHFGSYALQLGRLLLKVRLLGGALDQTDRSGFLSTRSLCSLPQNNLLLIASEQPSPRHERRSRDRLSFISLPYDFKRDSSFLCPG